MKLKKVSKFVIFGLNENNTEIVVKPFDNTLPADPVSDDERKLNPHYAEFRSQLPLDQCRYGVYDLAQEKEGAVRNKIVFFHWYVSKLCDSFGLKSNTSVIRAPDNARIKSKMISSSSKDVIRRALVGVSTEIEAQDPEDLEIKNGEPDSSFTSGNTLMCFTTVSLKVFGA